MVKFIAPQAMFTVIAVGCNVADSATTMTSPWYQRTLKFIMAWPETVITGREISHLDG